MGASKETSSSQNPGKSGKRQKAKQHRNKQALNLPSQIVSTPTTQTESHQDMDSAPLSFEAKIARALAGDDWQQLQSNNTHPIAVERPSTTRGNVGNAEKSGAQLKIMTKKQKKKQARFDKRVSKDAGDVLEVIEADSIPPVHQDVVWDQEPELLCSYNWKASNDQTNTIFVPGEPAKWHPASLPHNLRPDSGFQYVDYNYARQPKLPYESMFQALRLMNPNYQFTDVDVLADRNSLRVLLEFVQGKFNGPFRLDLYAIFNTLIIVRNEHGWWRRSDGISHGCNFEKFFTKPAPGMEDATSHYRAIRYPMGPLSVVCRFEADAYDDGAPPDTLTSPETCAVSGGLAMTPSFAQNAPIKTLQKGHIVPISQIVELKTKVIRIDERGCKSPSQVACQDQLWFGRTSLLYTAPYNFQTGTIKRVKCEDASNRVKAWEKANQQHLRKLAALLAQLRTIIKREQRPNHAVIVVRKSKDGPLFVRSMKYPQKAIGRDAFVAHWKWASTQRGGGERSDGLLQQGGNRPRAFGGRGVKRGEVLSQFGRENGPRPSG